MAMRWQCRWCRNAFPLRRVVTVLHNGQEYWVCKTCIAVGKKHARLRAQRTTALSAVNTAKN